MNPRSVGGTPTWKGNASPAIFIKHTSEERSIFVVSHTRISHSTPTFDLCKKKNDESFFGMIGYSGSFRDLHFKVEIPELQASIRFAFDLASGIDHPKKHNVPMWQK